MSGRISGQREHKGEIVAKAEWEAIITPGETQRLRAKLGDPDRRTNRSARRYLLARLLRCGLCGRSCSRAAAGGWRLAAMSARAARASVAAARSTIVAEPLESFIVEAVLHRLDSPELAAILNGRPRRCRERPAGRPRSSRRRAAGRACRDVGQHGDQPCRVAERSARRSGSARTIARKRLATLNRSTAL